MMGIFYVKFRNFAMNPMRSIRIVAKAKQNQSKSDAPEYQANPIHPVKIETGLSLHKAL